jgi:hypothetical protein
VTLELRLDHATLTVDGTLAERQLRDCLGKFLAGKTEKDLRDLLGEFIGETTAARKFCEYLGKLLMKGVFVKFTVGKIHLAAGLKWLKVTLVTVNGAVIHGSTIEFLLEPALLERFFGRILANVAAKFRPLVSAVTRPKPALVLDLSKIPAKYSVTVKAIAFVPGAAIVTVGPCSLRLLAD